MAKKKDQKTTKRAIEYIRSIPTKTREEIRKELEAEVNEEEVTFGGTRISSGSSRPVLSSTWTYIPINLGLNDPITFINNSTTPEQEVIDVNFED